MTVTDAIIHVIQTVWSPLGFETLKAPIPYGVHVHMGLFFIALLLRVCRRARPINLAI